MIDQRLESEIIVIIEVVGAKIHADNVCRHTEGTAGLASLIATSQSLQNAVIPPNMHFRNLSSRVAPFYSNLNVPTKPLSWPAPVTGQPRRASINSFGKVHI